MVTGYSSPKNRSCPALGKSITATECGSRRNSEIACPYYCPHNPFGPDNSDLFDKISARALKKFIHRFNRLGLDEQMARAFEDTCRRFRDTSDVEIMSFETQFAMLNAAPQDGGPSLFQDWKSEGFKGLNNDERIIIDCFHKSRIYYLAFEDASPTDPTYSAVDILSGRKTPITFVDSDQNDLLESGCAALGRFIRHGDHLYNLCGFTVITVEERAGIDIQIRAFLEAARGDESIDETLQRRFPETWAMVTDYLSEGIDYDNEIAEAGDEASAQEAPPADLRFESWLPLSNSADAAIKILETSPILRRLETFENPAAHALFEAIINIVEEDADEAEDAPLYPEFDDEEPIVNQYSIGHVIVFDKEISISAINPVEGSLLKEVIRLQLR